MSAVVIACAGLAAAAVLAVAVVLVAAKQRPPARPPSGPAPAGPAQLPPPSPKDAMCVTYMKDGSDTGDCHALLYNHCTDGYKDQSAIPAGIAAMKGTALAQLYAAEKPHFAGKPADWTTVCAARPDKVGRGPCAGMKAGEFRVWAAGKQAGSDPAPCVAGGALYLKAHFSADGRLLVSGTVGHG